MTCGKFIQIYITKSYIFNESVDVSHRKLIRKVKESSYHEEVAKDAKKIDKNTCMFEFEK